jgi:hypothetical protein
MAPENQKKLKGLLDAYGVKTGGKAVSRASPVKAAVKAPVKKARK